jgi:two-component system, NtrC family, nitrogen regulation response regulator NtrX
MAVRATRLGALDFLEKPISTDKLLLTVENALKLKRLETENSELRRQVGVRKLVWTGETMRRVMAQIDRVAATETRVCIYGETGTGKELVARTLHDRSPRAGRPFVTLNCAAIPTELIESELFGHEKFEQAHRGTLFLDEIGDMPLALQTRLLRVLEESEVERIGGDKPIAVDVRVLVATHRNLEEMIEAGSFRRDLYHRVVVFPITLPPLRSRQEDIPALVEYFAAQICNQNNWKMLPFTPAAIEALQRGQWRGNVRELRNVVERILLLADGAVDRGTVEMVLPGAEGEGDGVAAKATAAAGSLANRVAEFERATLLSELNRNHHHITNTAKSLGLERSHFYKKCQQLGIALSELGKEGAR